MTYDFKKAKDDSLTKPRDIAWENWAKFEKVGDQVQGYIRDVFYRQGDDVYKDQRGITLEQPTGELINVGIKQIDFITAKTDALRLGDPLTIILEKESPSKTKGYSATKIYAFYGKNLEENKDNKTVKELEAEDKLAGGTVSEEEAKAGKDFDDFDEPENSLDGDPLGDMPEEK